MKEEKKEMRHRAQSAEQRLKKRKRDERQYSRSEGTEY